jgi:hypothetical protein
MKIMNYLLHAIQNIKKIVPKDPPKILGRWNIDYCNTKINNKIDLSNEDHCGPCGQYAFSKQTTHDRHPYKNNDVIHKEKE